MEEMNISRRKFVKNTLLASAGSIVLPTIISSCESGIGRINIGEGMLSLHKGFFYGGTNNMIFSLWNVFDRSTSILMEKFYSNLDTDWNYSTALRQAKLEMIDDDNLNFPGFWSSFIIIGD